MPIVRGASFRFAPGPRSYDYLMEFKVVRDWVMNYPGSTLANYLYGLEEFLKSAGVKDPGELLEDSRVKGLLLDYVRRLQGEGKATKAWNHVKAIKSFMAYHDRPITLKRQERVKVQRKKVVYEHVPSKKEIYMMLGAPANLRDEAVILSLWQSGVRVGCLCRWQVGMVYDQLYPEVKVPVVLKISSETDTKLSGYSLGYYVTFLGKEAAEAVKEWLEWRKQHNHNLKPKAPLFVSNAIKPLKPSVVRDMVKRLAPLAKIDPETIWPHMFRKAFKKILNAADIDEDTREALMGHRLPGSRENYFDRHDIDEVAEKYMSCNFSSETVSEDARKEIEELKERLRAVEQVPPSEDPRYADLKIPQELRYSINQIVKDYLGKTTTEEFVAGAIRDKVSKERNFKSAHSSGDCSNGNCDSTYETRRVDENELDSYLSQGWEFVSQIISGKIIVKRLRR